MGSRTLVRFAWVGALAVGCVAPRVKPLTGLPVTGAIPRAELPPGHARLVFRWDYDDPLFAAKGEGVARIAPPDSVRLDFFVDGGVGSGGAILIGDSLRTAGEDGRRYLPPVPLLWAALGVLRVPGADTVARLDGDTLRIEIGRDSSYRAAFVRSGLVSVGRITGGRLREQVRRDSTGVAYRYFSGRRSLTLTSLRRIPDAPYDPEIWRQ
ncbi:MAG: hypothetical protein ACT4P7_14015 [Gemmatimonadaceae bacterium]